MKIKINLLLRKALLATLVTFCTQSLHATSYTLRQLDFFVETASGDGIWKPFYAGGVTTIAPEKDASNESVRTLEDTSTDDYDAGLYGGFMNGNHESNTHLIIEGADLQNGIYGGSRSGVLRGDVIIDYDIVTSTGHNIYAANEDGEFYGNTVVNVDSDVQDDNYQYLEWVYGGSKAGSFEGSSTLNIYQKSSNTSYGLTLVGGNADGIYEGTSRVNVGAEINPDKENLSISGIVGGNWRGDFIGISFITINEGRVSDRSFSGGEDVDIHGGSYSGNFFGESYITLNGGQVAAFVFGGNSQGVFTGDSHITLNEVLGDQFIDNDIFGGSENGYFVGDSLITVDGGLGKNATCIGAGNYSGSFKGNSNLILNAGEIHDIYGGNRIANDEDAIDDEFIGNVNIVLNGGTVDGSIYGGSYAGSFVGDVSITVDGADITASAIYGGTKTERNSDYVYDQGSISLHLLSGSLGTQSTYLAGIRENNVNITTDSVYLEIADAFIFHSSTNFIDAEYQSNQGMALDSSRKVSFSSENSSYDNVHDLTLKNFGEIEVAKGSTVYLLDLENHRDALNQSIVKTGQGLWGIGRTLTMEQIIIEEGSFEILSDVLLEGDTTIKSGAEFIISSGTEGDSKTIARLSQSNTLTINSGAILSFTYGNDGLFVYDDSNNKAHLMLENANTRFNLNIKGSAAEQFSQKLFTLGIDTDAADRYSAAIRESNIVLKPLDNDFYGLAASELLTSYNGSTALEGLWFIWENDELRFTNSLTYTMRDLTWKGGSGSWGQTDAWLNQWHSYDTGLGYEHTFDNDYQGGNKVTFAAGTGTIHVAGLGVKVNIFEVDYGIAEVDYTFEGGKITVINELDLLGADEIYFNGGLDASTADVTVGSAKMVYIEGDVTMNSLISSANLEISGKLTVNSAITRSKSIVAESLKLSGDRNVFDSINVSGHIDYTGELEIGNTNQTDYIGSISDGVTLIISNTASTINIGDDLKLKQLDSVSNSTLAVEGDLSIDMVLDEGGNIVAENIYLNETSAERKFKSIRTTGQLAYSGSLHADYVIADSIQGDGLLSVDSLQSTVFSSTGISSIGQLETGIIIGNNLMRSEGSLVISGTGVNDINTLLVTVGDLTINGEVEALKLAALYGTDKLQNVNLGGIAVLNGSTFTMGGAVNLPAGTLVANHVVVNYQLSKSTPAFNVHHIQDVSTMRFDIADNYLAGLGLGNNQSYTLVSTLENSATDLQLNGSSNVYSANGQNYTLSLDEVTGSVILTATGTLIANNVWVGDGIWDDEPSDWRSGIVPSADARVLFSGQGELSVALDGAKSIASMLVSGATYSFSGDALTVTSLSVAEGAGLILNNVTTVTGALSAAGVSIENNSALSVGADSQVTALSGTGSLAVAANATVEADSITQSGLSIAASATVNVAGSAVLGSLSSEGSLKVEDALTLTSTNNAGGHVSAASLTLDGGEYSFDSLTVHNHINSKLTSSITLEGDSRIGGLYDEKVSLSAQANLTLGSKNAHHLASLHVVGALTLQSSLQVNGTLRANHIVFDYALTAVESNILNAGSLDLAGNKLGIEITDKAFAGLRLGNDETQMLIQLDTGLAGIAILLNGENYYDFGAQRFSLHTDSAGNVVILAELSGNRWQSSTGLWNNDTTAWSEGVLPTDEALFMGEGETAVKIAGNKSVERVYIDSDLVHYSFSGDQLNTTTLSLYSGGLTVGNTIVVDGDVTSAAAASLIVAKGGELDLKGSLNVDTALNNEGTIRIGGESAEPDPYSALESIHGSGSLILASGVELESGSLIQSSVMLGEDAEIYFVSDTTVEMGSLQSSGRMEFLHGGSLHITQATQSGGDIEVAKLSLSANSRVGSLVVEELRIHGDITTSTNALNLNTIVHAEGAGHSITIDLADITGALAIGHYTILDAQGTLSWADFALSAETNDALAQIINYGNIWQMEDTNGNLQITVQAGPAIEWHTSSAVAGMYNEDVLVPGSEIALITSPTTGAISSYDAFAQVRSIHLDADTYIDLTSIARPVGQSLKLANIAGSSEAELKIGGNSIEDHAAVLYNDRATSSAGSINVDQISLSVENSETAGLSLAGMSLKGSELLITTPSQLSVGSLVAEATSTVINEGKLQLGEGSVLASLSGSGETTISQGSNVQVDSYSGDKLRIGSDATLQLGSDASVRQLDNSGTLDITGRQLVLADTVDRAGDIKAGHLIAQTSNSVGTLTLGSGASVSAGVELHIASLNGGQGTVGNEGSLILSGGNSQLGISGAGSTTVSQNSNLSLGAMLSHQLVIESGANLTLGSASSLNSLSNAGMLEVQGSLSLASGIGNAGTVEAQSLILHGASSFNSLTVGSLSLGASLSSSQALASVGELGGLNGGSFELNLASLSTSIANGSYLIINGEGLSWDMLTLSADTQARLDALVANDRIYSMTLGSKGLELMIMQAPVPIWNTSSNFVAMYDGEGTPIENTKVTLFTDRDTGHIVGYDAFDGVEAAHVDGDVLINLSLTVNNDPSKSLKLQNLTGEAGTVLQLKGSDTALDNFALFNTFDSVAHSDLELDTSRLIIENSGGVSLSLAKLRMQTAVLEVKQGAQLVVHSLNSDTGSSIRLAGQLTIGGESHVAQIEGDGIVVSGANSSIIIDVFDAQRISLGENSTVSINSDATLTELINLGSLKLQNNTLTLEASSSSQGKITAKNLIANADNTLNDVEIIDTLSVLDGKKITVNSLSSYNEAAQVSGEVSITGNSGNYQGSYKNASLSMNAEGALQELKTGAELSLSGSAGQFTLHNAAGAAAQLKRIQSTGVNIDMRHLGAQTLTLGQASNMSNASLLMSFDAATFANTLNAQNIFAGAAISITGQSEIMLSAYNVNELGSLRSLADTTDVTLIDLDESIVSIEEGVSFIIDSVLSKYIENYVWDATTGTLTADIRTTFYEDVQASGNGVAGMNLAIAADKAGVQTAAPTSDLAQVLNALDTLITQGDVAGSNRLAAALAGSSVTSLGSSMVSSVENQLRNLRARSGQTPKTDEFDAWITAEGNFSELNAVDTLAGHSLNTWGGSIGATWGINDNAYMGLSFSALYGDLDAQSTDYGTGELDSYYINFYSSLKQGRWNQRFIGSIGFVDAQLDRHVYHAEGTYNNSGNTDGIAFGLMYELGYEIAFDEKKKSILEPLVQASFISTSLSDYTESGGNARLHVGEQENNYFTLGVGVRYSQLVTDRFNYFAHAFVSFDLGDRQSEAHVRLADIASDSQGIYGADPGAVGVELGLGASYMLNEQSSLYSNSSIELRSEYSNVNVTIGYRLSF